MPHSSFHRTVARVPALTRRLIARALGTSQAASAPRAHDLHTRVRSRMQFEPMEQRVLMSADLLPAAAPAGGTPALVEVQQDGEDAARSLDLQLSAVEGGPRFVTRFDAGNFSTPLQPLAPRGSLVHAGGVAGRLDAATDAAELTLTVEAGRPIALRLQTAADAADPLQLRLEVFDADGNALGFVSAGQGGEALSLQLAPTAGGALRIQVTRLDGAGDYQLALFLGAHLEGEDTGGMADAASLDDLFTVMPGGSGRADGESVAVIGHLDPAGYMPPFAREDFEQPLGDAWSLSSTNPDAALYLREYYRSGEQYAGRALYSGGDGAYGGEASASELGTLAVDGYDDTLHEMVWTVDVTNRGALVLEFDHWGWDPLAEGFSGALFSGSEFADGVALSVDGGNTWVPVMDLPSPTYDPLRYRVDLSAVIAAQGLALGGTLQLKFQHADMPFADDGGYVYVGERYWDNISLRESRGVSALTPLSADVVGTIWGSPHMLTDGILPVAGTHVDSASSVVWEAYTSEPQGLQAADAEGTWVTIDYGAEVRIADLELVMQDEDTLRVEYSLDGQDWNALTVFGPTGEGYDYGMVVRSTLTGAEGFQASADFEAVQARWLRISGVQSVDSLHALGEVTAYAREAVGDAEDWYAITLEEGEVVSLALQQARDTGIAGGAPTLQVFDAAGTLLTLGLQETGGGTAVHGLRAPATGTYYVQVGSLLSGEYQLAVTRNALLGSARPVLQDLGAVPVVADHIDAAGGGAASGSVRVAVHRGDSLLLSLLNDGALGIEAVSVVGSQIDSLDELAQFDVVVIGADGYRDEYAAFAGALRAWVEGGGGLVATGWTVANTGAGYWGSGQTLVDIDAVVPVATSGSYSYSYGNTLDVADIDHPVTQGLVDRSLPGIYSEYAVAGVDPDAFILATIGSQAAVVVGEKVAGRGVYLGPTYLSSSYAIDAELERLLEQSIAWAAGDSARDYAVGVAAGTTLGITATPQGQEEGEPTTTLVPRLQLLDADGNVLVESDTGTLAYTASEDQRLRVRLSAASGAGGVVLRASGASPAYAESFGVQASTLDGLQRGTALPASVDLFFDQAVLLSSVALSDFTVNGASAIGFEVLAGNRLRFHLDAVSGDGVYTFAVAGGALQDIHGQGLASWSRSFELDTTAPTVAATSIAQGERIDGSARILVLEFSEALDSAEIDASDAWLVDLRTGSTVAFTAFAYDEQTHRLALGLPELGDGPYQVWLASGYYAFKDLLGQYLDGQPGSGEYGMPFVLDFVVDAPELDLTALPAMAPLASLVHGRLLTGGLDGTDDTDRWRISVDADQQLTVFARPAPGVYTDGTLRFELTVHDAEGAVVAQATGEAGTGVLLQNLRAAGGGALPAGTYHITLRNLEGEGAYEIGVLLGAGVEAETAAAAQPPANDTLAQAEDMEASFIALGQGGSRGAMLGSLASADDADLYRVQLQQGQGVDIVVAQAAGGLVQGGLMVDVLDADGVLLAAGVPIPGAAQQAVRGWIVDATGDYLLRVHGSSAALYTLTVTRNLAIELPPAQPGVLPDISATQQVLGHMGGSGGGGSGGAGAIRVAVFNGGGGSGLVNQLNDDTWFDFDAVSVTADRIDTIAELGAFDVVIIGDSNSASQYGSFAPALRQWVEAGGGLVATGWTIYAAGATTAPVLPDIDAVVPVDTTVAYNWFGSGSIDVRDIDHPATQGIADFYHGNYIEYSSQGADPGATVLATVNNRPFAVVGEPGLGRSAYLGAVYYHGYPGSNASLDRLLEQTVAWAAINRDDSYRLQVGAGDVLTLATQTPGDGADAPANTLATRIELYDAQGTLVASATGGAADGRNTVLEHTALDGGSYRVRVVAVAGTGGYVLTVQGATGAAPAQAPVVTSASPDARTPLAAALDEIVVQFSEGLRLDTVGVDDLVIESEGSVLSVEVLAGNRLRFVVDIPPVEGLVDYHFAEGAFTDLQGTASAAYSGSVLFDLGGARVVSSQPDTVANAPLSQWSFEFNETIDPSSVSIADVAVFTGPDGSDLRNRINSIAVQDKLVTVFFSSQTQVGAYTMVLGPQIRDMAGNAMDQDADGTAGEAADDRFSATLNLRAPDLLPTAFVVPQNAQFGQTISLSWTVRNAGDGPTYGSWYDLVWLSRDTILGNDDYQLGSVYYSQSAIAPDGTYTRTAQFTLPLNLQSEAGSYHLLLEADGYEYQAERQEGNNVLASAALALTLPLLPDLVVENVQAPPVIEAGKSVTISWTQRNQGEGATTSGWYDRVYLSSDAQWSGNDIHIASAYTSAVLAAGEARERSLSLTIPTAHTGTWYVIVRGDADDYVEELQDEGNNDAASAATVQVVVATEDLVPTAVSAPTGATLGQTVTVAWTVANQGTGTTVTNWYDRLWLSTDTTLSANDISLGTFTAGSDAPLAAGAQYQRSRDVVLPLLDTLAAGTYYVLVQTDAGSQEPETNEGNNLRASAAMTVAVPPHADLAVSNVVVPAGARAGDTVSIRFTLANLGTAAASDFYYRVALTDSDTPGSVSLTLTSRLFTDTLAAGASIEVTQQVTLPIDRPGNWYVGVSADSTGVVYERGQEANNHALSARTSIPLPPLPDLRVTSITAPQDALAGQVVPLTWTVANQGTAGLRAAGWVDRVYLSLDGGATLSIHVGDFRYEGVLDAGSALTRTQNITLPADRIGNYTVVVITDYNNDNYEYAGEENNRVSDDRVIATAFPPLPNLRVTSITPPTDAFSSTETVVSWVVTNTGSGATSAPRWYDTVVLSLNSVYGDGDDIVLGHVSNPNYLPTGESYVSSLSFTVPRGLAGDYRLLVFTDAGRSVVEDTGEADNLGISALTRFSLTPPPDLRVTSVQAPAQAFSGQPMSLTWTVTNEGSGRTLETVWSDRVFVSTDDVFDASDIELGRFAHSGALDPDAFYTNTQQIGLPVGSAGPRWFFVVTDFANQVYEHAAEDNNRGTDATPTDVLLTPPPDLEVSAIVLPASERAGNLVNLQYTVTNFGATATAESWWVDRFYLSRDAVLDASDILLDSRSHGGVLAVDGSYSATVPLRLPDTAQGAWYVLVHADAANQVFEGLAGASGDPDANNISASATTIDVAYRPANLVVESFTVPATGEAGKPVLIEWTLRNIGSGATQASYWIDRIIASTDDIVGDDDDILLASTSPGNILAAGAALAQSARVSLPFGMEGNYRIYLVVDATGLVFEGAAGETDNRAVRSMAVTRDVADLRVSSLAATPPASADGRLQVAWRVENQGANRTDGNYWYDRVWLSLDGTLDSGDILLGSVFRGNPLNVGEGYDASASLALPAGLSAGNYRLLLQTDARGEVTEGAAGEANNVRMLDSVLVLGPEVLVPVLQPDLRVTAVDAPAEAISGQSLQVSWTVRNDSDDATPARGWYDAVYLSRDLVFDRNTDIYLGYADRSEGLAAGASYTQTRSFTVPLGQSGPFYVFVVTDSGRVIAEALETNNSMADSGFTQVSLAPPADLVVGDITVPANAIPGRNATLTYTVHNQGTNAALGSWRDAVYLSTDDQWDIGDLFFGAVQHHGNVAGGGSYTETLTAALPGLTPGSYRVIVRSDILNAVPESRDDNNLAASLDAVDIDVESLVLGTAASGTIATGQTAFYKVVVTAGETVRVVLDSQGENNGNELYLRFDAMPTRGVFDHAGRDPFVPDQMVVIPSTQAGTYYLMVHGSDGAAARPYTLTASILPFSLQAVDQHSVGNAGLVTLRVDGARFDAATQFALVNEAGENILASAVVLEGSARAYVTFDARGATLGAYTLAAVAADETVATYGAPISVVAGVGAEVVKRIDGPAQVRPDRVILANLVYTNQGDADTMAPLFIVTSPTGTRFGSTAETIGLSNSVQLLGVSADGPQDVLRPGDSNSLPLLFESVNGPMRFNTRAIEATSTEALDYTLIEQSLRMPGMSDSAWQTRWLTQIQPRLGGTWGAYVQLVNALSKQFSTADRTISDVRELFDLAFRADPDFLVSSTIEGVLHDAATGGVLAGVKVAAFRKVGDSYELAGSAITDANGAYAIRYLQPGEFVLALGGSTTTDADGITGASSPYLFDMNRDGQEDADSPRVTLTHAADRSGLQLFARAPAEVARDDQPAVATDAAGRLHMVWLRDGQLWHAVDSGAGWENAAPLPPGAEGGQQLQLLADPRLVDGSSEGLLATWRSGEGNAAEIHYSIGQRQADGSYRWSEPALLTANAWFDGAYAVAVGADGVPVYVGQRADASGSDDTELYSGTTAFEGLQWAQTLDEFLLHVAEANAQALAQDGAMEDSNTYRYRWAYKIGRSVPLWNKLEAEFRVDLRGQLDCTLLLAGNGALRVKIGDFEVEGRAGGDLRFTANKETCTYEFDSGRISFQAAGAYNPKITLLAALAPAAYPALVLADLAGVSLRVEVAVGGRLVWTAGDSLTWDDADKQGTFRVSGGAEYDSKNSSFGGFIRLLAGGDIKLRVLVNSNWLFGGPDGFRPADQPITLSGLFRWPAPWGGWREITVSYPGTGEAPLGADLMTLDQLLAHASGGADFETTYGYEAPPVDAGTWARLGSSGEQQLTHNLGNEGAPVIAESTDGALWLGYATAEGGVAVAARGAGTWLAAETIPGSDEVGVHVGDVALAVDGNGDVVAVWSRFDANGLDANSSSAEIEAAFSRGSDWMVARRDAATGTWSTPQRLLERAGDDRSMVLQRVAGGDLVAAWIGASTDLGAADTATVFAMRWSAATASWSAAQAVASGRNLQRVAVAERAGAPVLVWSETGDAGNVLRTASWDGLAFGAAQDMQIALATALVDLQAGTRGDTLEDGFLEGASLSLPSPPDECCDEDDDDPYEPEPVVPRDPNDILGPAGFGEERWIPAGDTLAYTIRFENAADAAAPAQEVVVTQQLDADLDWRTFRVDDFGFGDQRILLEGNTAFYQGRLDYSATRGFVLDVSVAIDTATGVVTWRLSTLDPATGELPLDAQLGFLPPNRDAEGKSDGRGEGFLSYTIKARRGVPSGTVIDAAARIVFDTEEPIDTPPIFNTLDAGGPVSAVEVDSATSEEPVFLVRWSGSDAEGGSALGGYSIYVSINGAPYFEWLADTTQTEALYAGEAGNTYRFYSVARDNAGNVEAAPSEPDAVVSVSAGVGVVAGLVFDDLDGDGVRDAGEAGLAGWTVFLDADADGAMDEGERSMLTDADGAYRFESVGAGTVTVGRVLQDGWRATAPSDNLQVVQVVADTTTDGADFGGYLGARLGGVMFDDRNANGVRDSGEAALAGWTLQLDRNNDGSVDATALTGDDGSYLFVDLAPGSYRITAVAQGGWLATTAADGHVLTATSGLVRSDLYFGSVQAASISGRQFDDHDGDGQFDAGEAVLPGWTVFIDSNGNGLLDSGERSTVTDAQGAYRFDNLLPGSYTVAQVLPTGWLQTAPAASTGAAGELLSGSAQELELPDAALDLTNLGTAATAGNGWAGALTGLDAFRLDPRFAGIDGAGMSVVVIDTGIDLDHAFFGPDADGDGIADRIVFQYDFAHDDADASDRNNHGSHIASIVGGADADYGGVAPGVDLIALKVFQDGGTGYFSYLENALRWVLAHADEFNVGVINLSLGDGGNWNTAINRFGLGDELAALAEKNIIVTAASGNHYAKFGGAWGVAYPSADPAVLSVGATWVGDLGGPWNFNGGATDYSTGADHVASFSQRDDTLLDIFAPGARLVGANANGGLATMQGTSQASAYMAGIAVLAQDLAQQTLGRRLSLAEFSALLDATAVRIVDGDDENDNVRNSGLVFQRVDMLALAEAILLMPAGNGGTTGGGTPGGGSGGSPATTPSAGTAVHSVTVQAGQDREGVDFGNFRLGRVDGVVFHDVDADGVQGAGEDGAGLAGIGVFIDANGNGERDTGELATTTDGQGRWQFADLGPGTRRIVLEAPEGFSVVQGLAQLTVTSGMQAQVLLAVNRLPTLGTIADQDVDEGGTVQLGVLGADSVGDALQYSLVGEVPAGAVIDAQTGVFTWTAPDGDEEVQFTVRVTDAAGGIREQGFTVRVQDIAPTLGVTGAATALAGEAYVLSLAAEDPGQDTITRWTIDWGDGIVQTVQGDPGQVAHVYAAGGRYVVTTVAHDEDGDHAAAGPTVDVTVPALEVTRFEATSTGFLVRFNRVFDPSQLNLYDATSHAHGAADIVFLDAAGRPVAGSVVVDMDGRGLRFVKTGGVLAAGSYSVTLHSGESAFATLDGNADGTSGDAFVTSFQTGAGAAVLSVGEIARGPGQDLNQPVAGSGLPVTLSNAAGATQLSFTLRYDPRLLVVNGVENGSSLPVGSGVEADLSVAGEVRITVRAAAPLGAGTLELLRLQATVRSDAPYGASHVLDLQFAQIDGGAIPVRDDDGVHVVAYLGDTTGDRAYTSDDVSLLQRVITRGDSGFGAYPLTDPVVLGDVYTSGTLTAADAARLLQHVRDGNRPEIPAIPPAPTFAAAEAPRIDFSTSAAPELAASDTGSTGGTWLGDWLAPEATPSSATAGFKLSPTPEGLKLMPTSVSAPVAPVLTRL